MRFSPAFVLPLLPLAHALALPSPSSERRNTTLDSRDADEPTFVPVELANHASSVITNCNVPGTFAMTFDDGPLYGGALASYFESQGSRTTFFLNGNNYDCIYDKAEDLKKRFTAGHLIGAHTWTHADIAELSASELDEELTLLETALHKILGIKPKYFRPPYGSYDAASLAILRKRGYTVVTWNVDSGDADGDSVSHSLNTYKSTYTKYPAPFMALNHETYKTTAKKVVPVVVPKLLAAGYKLVTVAQCLGDPHPYQQTGTPAVRDASWTCKGTPSGRLRRK